jgi:mevalonate kinase
MHASAPAKLILCGEHAVVYGRPAIAVPLAAIRATARVEPGPPGAGLRFDAPDLGRSWAASEQPDDPLSRLALDLIGRLTSATENTEHAEGSLPRQPLTIAVPAVANDLLITIASDIPIASGMGSGAAIATAIVRALAAYTGVSLEPATIAALVYESERHFHGTPSGIDNTVVAYERAIWFVRARQDEGGRTKDEGQSAGEPLSSSVFRPSSPTIEPLTIAAPLTLVVGDTGLRSATRLPVAAVRERWQAEPARYEALFDAIGAVARAVRAALAAGDAAELGDLFNRNQSLLEQIGVSSPELDRLVAAARAAGALGAKLSGAGWGGVMVALCRPADAPQVAAALRAAGAAGALITTVSAQ